MILAQKVDHSANFEVRTNMKCSIKRQQDKDFHTVKQSPSRCWIPPGQMLDLSALLLLKTKVIHVFTIIIFLLVTTFFLVLIGDRGSVVQIGLHLPRWPQTINNLRATREFGYNNVYPEEEVIMTKLSLENLARSIPKSASNLGSGNEGDLNTKADSSPSLEDAGTTTVNSEEDLLLQQRAHQSANASSVLVAPRDRAQEVHYADQGNGWLQFPYITSNESEQLTLQITRNGTLPCHDIRTQSAQILGLPQPSMLEGDEGPVIRLYAGPVYELTIVSIRDDAQPRCAGGDYYETDLSGPLWKSRPPVLDNDNGTYSVKLQMNAQTPRFVSGVYTFTIILLFSNFHALHHHPQKWARMEQVANYQIKFVVPESSAITHSPADFSSKSESSLANSDSEYPSLTSGAPNPELPMCKLEDFSKKYWSGRWTREEATEDCEYDKYGRWICVNLDLKCQKPWCEGPVGSLESNGWVYSAHCAFKIFNEEEAWKCLDGKWLFFWGDSNHMDTIRNLLNFVLGFEHRFSIMERRQDITYFHPRSNRSSVRITSMFNGHSNVTLNYEGLQSLHDPDFAEQLKSFFTGDSAPDIMIMNSGLHDGVYWKDVDRFMQDGVEFAAAFWARVWSEMKARRPDLFYRTTVSTGGRARNMSYNPHKMELFNHLMVDRFSKMKLERFHIIDGFDYTYPWHFDHKTNDGVHYGRRPSKSKWAGGNIGHRYFVDLMLVHMLLNALCAPSSHSSH